MLSPFEAHGHVSLVCLQHTWVPAVLNSCDIVAGMLARLGFYPGKVWLSDCMHYWRLRLAVLPALFDCWINGSGCVC